MMQRISNTIKTNAEKTIQTIKEKAPSLAKTAAQVSAVFALTGTMAAAGLKGLSHPSLNQKKLQPMHILPTRK